MLQPPPTNVRTFVQAVGGAGSLRYSSLAGLRTLMVSAVQQAPSAQTVRASKDETVVLCSILQNPSESADTRVAACESVLNLTKSEGTCSALCAVGGIHAVINALKSAGGSVPLLRCAVQALCNLYRFDSKLTTVVVRLQDGIGVLLEALRDNIHCGDVELLVALLTALSDVSSNTSNVQILVKHSGTAAVLAAVLAHLKNDALLLPALQAQAARGPPRVALPPPSLPLPHPPRSPAAGAARSSSTLPARRATWRCW